MPMPHLPDGRAAAVTRKDTTKRYVAAAVAGNQVQPKHPSMHIARIATPMQTQSSNSIFVEKDIGTCGQRLPSFISCN